MAGLPARPWRAARDVRSSVAAARPPPRRARSTSPTPDDSARRSGETRRRPTVRRSIGSPHSCPKRTSFISSAMAVTSCCRSAACGSGLAIPSRPAPRTGRRRLVRTRAARCTSPELSRGPVRIARHDAGRDAAERSAAFSISNSIHRCWRTTSAPASRLEEHEARYAPDGRLVISKADRRAISAS